MKRIKFRIPCTTPTRRWWQVRRHSWEITKFLNYSFAILPPEVTSL